MTVPPSLRLRLPPNPFDMAFAKFSPASEADSSLSSEDSLTWPSVLDMTGNNDTHAQTGSPSLRATAQHLARHLGLQAPSPSSELPSPRERHPISIAPVSKDAYGSPAVSPNVLWLGGLDYWMEEGYVVGFLACGDALIVTVTQRRCIRSLGWDANLKTSPGEPAHVQVGVKMSTHSGSSGSGYCFLTFPSAAHATAVMQLFEARQQRTLMPGSDRTFKLNWATGQTGSQPLYNEHSIFVADLPKEASESDLVDLFGPLFPSFRSAQIVYDGTTGQHKGHAFVRFSDSHDSQRALTLGRNPNGTGLSLRGRPLRISEATVSGNHAHRSDSPSPSQGVFVQPFHPRSDSSPNVEFPPIAPDRSFPCSDVHPPSRRPIPPRHASPHGTLTDLINELEPENCTVFVGNLPSSISEDILARHFQHYGSIVYVKVPPGRNCGFVQYTTRQEAERAMAKMQGYPILASTRIRLSWARNPSDKVMEHVRKLSQALSIPFDDVHRMVSGADRTVLKQLTKAVTAGQMPLSPVAFNLPERYHHVGANQFAPPILPYGLRASNGVYQPASEYRSPSTTPSSPYSLSDGLSSLSMGSSPAPSLGRPCTPAQDLRNVYPFAARFNRSMF